MSKKIVGDDGKTYVQKKPLYKRFWVWFIAIIAVNMSNNDKSTSSSGSSTTKSTSSTNAASSSSKVSTEFSSALAKAKTYSSVMKMSKAGIYDQLTSESGEKFPADAAQYAIDNLKADYNANALSKAKTYQKDMNMSTEAIRDQLTSDSGEKFTQEEADYAVQHLSD